MEFQIIWFILWGVLWAVYFMLDGFDFGVGMLQGFIARKESEKKMLLQTIGPVWDGNEVWLITAGGATFAAFPTTYALMFSYLYSALLIILFALILRGVAIEFRGKVDRDLWKKACDMGIFLGSSIPSLLFGVAFGNIFRGLPMDSSGYHGTLLSLLNPYGILTGLFFLLMFLEHGSLWATLKSDGDLSDRTGHLAGTLWFFLFLTAVGFLAASKFTTNLYDNYLQHPALFLIPAIAVGSLIGIKVSLFRKNFLFAFFSSCLMIFMVTLTGVTGLYPNLIPSSIDPNYSLTIFNSSSSVYTLRIMTVVALIFVPIVISYQIWTFRIFRQKTTHADVAGTKGHY